MLKKILLTFIVISSFVFLQSCSSISTSYRGQEYFTKNLLENQVQSELLTRDAYNFLQTNNLLNRFKTQPKEVIKYCIDQTKKSKVNSEIIANSSRLALKTIIELSIFEAKKHHNIEYWTSACYLSYEYLFNKNIHPNITNLRTPDIGTVIFYYNYSLYHIFKYLQNNNMLNKKNIVLPSLVNKIKISSPHTDIPWKLNTFNDFTISSDYISQTIDINSFISKDLNENVFSKGIGIALNGVPKDNDRFPPVGDYLRYIKYLYPMTFVLEFSNTGTKNEVIATPNYLDFYKNTYFNSNNENVLLSSNFSSTAAQFLNEYKLTDNYTSFFNPGDMISKKEDGLYMLEPYDPNKIPVVFIHGFISSPMSLYQITNTLMQYSSIKDKYQLWFYYYPTGQPIFLSTFSFKQALLSAKNKFASNGNIKNFNKMVLVGYSLGGIMAQLCVQTSTTKDWEKILFKDKGINPKSINNQDREVIKELLEFSPLDFIKTVIFVSTPHRGASMANLLALQIATDFAKSPADYYSQYHDVFKFFAKQSKKRDDNIISGNSANNLIPGSDFIKLSENLPFSKNVNIYSIIGDEDRADKLNGSDGITKYESSHMNDVTREIIIKSTHYSVYKPATAKEILRILLENSSNTKKNQSKST